jgi:hypothetical protein
MRNTLLILSILLLGCTKYPQDGSLFHFRSPEKRILGVWEDVRIDEVGEEPDTHISELLGSNNLQLELEFLNNKTVTILNIGDNIIYEGDWSFNEDNSILQLNVSDSLNTINIYWKIIELELDDLQCYQFREYNGEDIYDYSYFLRFEKIN